ncbi:putative lipase/esterase family protein [Aspergillus stella-maris]|uniref:putative lipase/esterase family protein n=1 Tax=Aspergillus stella-maris TaxID=1810926 RepID=UPI003CCD962C
MLFLFRALRILKDALFTPSLSLKTRILMLALQPITLLTYSIEYYISRRFPHDTEIQIPLWNGEKVRAVVYIPPAPPSRNPHSSPSREKGETKKVPIHLNIHGGAFLGGLPEGNARFCHALSKSGVLVISSAYRYAPIHTFPDAHEDVVDVAKWILENAEGVWGADIGTFTVSGFSVGGNLALGLAQQLRDDSGTKNSRVKGLISFEGVVDFRLPPSLKPKPKGYPIYDPLSFLMPLFDTYAGPNRIRDIEDPLLHPTLADIEALPRNMFFVVGGRDILFAETAGFVERLVEEARGFNRGLRGGYPREEDEGEIDIGGKNIVVRSFVAEGQIHGWTEMPSFAINVELRDRAFSEAIAFLGNVHAVYSSSK